MIQLVNNIKIYKTKFPGNGLDIYKNIEAKLIPTYNQADDSRYFPVKNGYCSFHTQFSNIRDMYKWPEFAEFVNFTKEHCAIYAESLGLNSEDMSVISGWASKWPHGAFTVPHSHSTEFDMISCGLYVQVPENSGDFLLGTYDHNNNIIDSITINLSAGDFILFPSNMMHWSTVNQSTDERIMLGVDISFDPKKSI